MTGHSHAIAAITRILTSRKPGDAPEVTAAHILAALHGHGWRPTQAYRRCPIPGCNRTGDHTTHATSEPTPPTEDYREARAIIQGRKP